MRVHCAAAIAVVITGAVLRIGAVQWACLALAIGLVLVAEMFNTVIEAMIDLQTSQFHPLAKAAKDGAAGAVLIASIAAIGVAIAVFVPRLLRCRAGEGRGGRRVPVQSRILAAAGAVIVLSAALAGCSVVNKINSIRNTVDKNRATITAFTQGLQNSKAVPFQATYVTAGGSPMTVVYAVQPPNDLSFSESASGGGSVATRLIANSSGEYSCSQASTGGKWTCAKLGKANASAQNGLFDIYTPSHWVTFLHVFAVGAGLAGDRVSTSTKTVNGFPMNCVDLFAKGNGTSTICTTRQNILGYVKVAGQPTVFEIKNYKSAPPASAFQLPPGATVARG
jgi:diacylglycerol kinase